MSPRNNISTTPTQIGPKTLEKLEGSTTNVVKKETKVDTDTSTAKEALKLFNSLGSPNLYYCSVFERNISANCARYIYHALIIQTYIYKKYEDTSIDIVEIGGGYGGLAYWLNVLNKNINKYSICDLDVITQFQKKCLDYYEVKCDFITNPYSFLKGDKPLFCISNYGFSEFNNYFQEIYTEYITSKADSGFMIWNNWTGIFPFTNNTMIKEKERPEFPDIYNLFIYF